MSKEESEALKKEDVINEGDKKQDEVEKTSTTDELAKTKQELEDTTDRFKRILAEFENYKKRSSKEREMLYNSILSDIISSFLPIIDNLEKAVETDTKDEDYRQGVKMVLQQFIDILKSLGVEQIETVGKTFDPLLHDAVSSVQDENLGEKEIKQEFRKGYKIGTKVIRHSMVVVAN